MRGFSRQVRLSSRGWAAGQMKVIFFALKKNSRVMGTVGDRGGAGGQGGPGWVVFGHRNAVLT